MRRIILTLVVLIVALQPSMAGASTTNPTQTSITCEGTGAHVGRLYRILFGRHPDRDGLAYWVRQRRSGLTAEEVALWRTRSAEYQQLYAGLDNIQFVHALYRNVLGRDADPEGHAYWHSLLGAGGRHGVVSWMAQTPEYEAVWPYDRSPICTVADQRDYDEAVPGIVVSGNGSTVTVFADRDLVSFGAVDGARTFASSVPGDVVVNANWFTAAGSQGPVVSNGFRSGSGDVIERGQLVAYRPECRGDAERLDHIWMGELYSPDSCVATAVSGVSLIHKGQRADAYPGITLTTGYTNVNAAHSFIGFDQDKIVVIATRQMNASQLADYALSLGVVEGVMLDGGGSTQIKTPTTGLFSSRPVTAFATLTSTVG